MGQPLTESERDAIARFLERVRAALPGLGAAGILFGSRARGEGRPDSDVDVVVVVAADDLPIRRRIFDLAYDVFLETEVLISPLVVTREGLAVLRRTGRRLAREIDRDGVAV
jgi:uncharacterized protein